MQVVTIMAKFIAWVANNMPCFNYRGKKESMVNAAAHHLPRLTLVPALHLLGPASPCLHQPTPCLHWWLQSFGLLRAVRNAAVLKYNQLCISNGWSDARELMATREFKVSPTCARWRHPCLTACKTHDCLACWARLQQG